MFLKLRTWRALMSVSLLSLLLLSGCATTNPRDPLEPMNRAIYQFNEGVDTVLFRPLAEGYRAVLPEFVRNSISSFFSNINDVLVALNNLLQGKVTDAATDVGRVLMNSTLGLGGLFDIASNLGVEKHNEDFGQTLGRWGVGDGPYLVLPLLGPSNLRDTLGRVVDGKADPIGYMHDVRWRNSLWATRFVNTRAELLDTSKIIETAALDPYEFVRDAYIQRRRNLIYDGAPPREKDEGGAAKPAEPPRVRGQGPFPFAADDVTAGLGTPVDKLSIDNTTPARASGTPSTDTRAPAPLVTREAPKTPVPNEPQVDLRLPGEPTGAGEAANETRDGPPRVVRVWTPMPAIGFNF